MVLIACASTPEEWRATMQEQSDEKLLEWVNMFNSQGVFTFSAPGGMKDNKSYFYAVEELTRRGYECNPTGCHKARN